jgi:TctA family transporter
MHILIYALGPLLNNTQSIVSIRAKRVSSYNVALFVKPTEYNNLHCTVLRRTLIALMTEFVPDGGSAVQPGLSSTKSLSNI